MKRIINKITDLFLGVKVSTFLEVGDTVTLNNPAFETSVYPSKHTIYYYKDYIVTKIYRNGDVSVKNLNNIEMPKKYSHTLYDKIISK